MRLKIEMAQMCQEISDLRKLVETCMDWQAKIQDYIRDEVASAISQSGEHLRLLICHYKVQM